MILDNVTRKSLCRNEGECRPWKKKKKKKIQTCFSEWPLRDYQYLTSFFSLRTLNSFKLYVKKIKKGGQFCQKAFLIISNKK